MQTTPTAPNSKGFSDKTLWDWLRLLGVLAIPLVVALASIVFIMQQANLAQQQHEADQQLILDQRRATTLQTYIDNIQDLLLNHNLQKSKPGDDVAILARARTLTALQGLDPKRKGTLIQFIYLSALERSDQARLFIETFLYRANVRGPHTITTTTATAAVIRPVTRGS
jgi:hypothetical protein